MRVFAFSPSQLQSQPAAAANLFRYAAAANLFRYTAAGQVFSCSTRTAAAANLLAGQVHGSCKSIQVHPARRSCKSMQVQPELQLYSGTPQLQIYRHTQTMSASNVVHGPGHPVSAQRPTIATAALKRPWDGPVFLTVSLLCCRTAPSFLLATDCPVAA